jgi:hypothetical protein
VDDLELVLRAALWHGLAFMAEHEAPPYLAEGRLARVLPTVPQVLHLLPEPTAADRSTHGTDTNLALLNKLLLVSMRRLSVYQCLLFAWCPPLTKMKRLMDPLIYDASEKADVSFL